LQDTIEVLEQVKIKAKIVRVLLTPEEDEI
jgi:hypothetical protein